MTGSLKKVNFCSVESGDKTNQGKNIPLLTLKKGQLLLRRTWKREKPKEKYSITDPLTKMSTFAA